MSARPAALAGQWYPARASACEAFFRTVGPPEVRADGEKKGAIVPHAGWVYSGAVAFEALRALAEGVKDADLVLLFGGHLTAQDRPRLLIEGGWQTPFGELPVAETLAQAIAMGIECELETPEDHYEDNALEVQMPMIKHLWPAAKVLGLGVPPTAEAAQIGREALRSAERHFRKIVVVGSTDLTHYGPNYNYHPHGRGFEALSWVKETNDRRLIDRVVAHDLEGIVRIARSEQSACCSGAVVATLSALSALGAKDTTLLRHTTSYDVLPRGEEPSSFVGYAGFISG